MNYTKIETEEQYDLYCKRLRELSEKEKSDSNEDEMEVIDDLLENWNKEHYNTPRLDNIQFLLALMDNHNLSLIDLKNITGLSLEKLDKIINYEIEIPQEVIKKLADRFKMREEAFINKRNKSNF